MSIERVELPQATKDAIRDNLRIGAANNDAADEYDEGMARWFGLTIAKLQTRIARKRRQRRNRDAALLRWRRWAEATFFGGAPCNVSDDDLMQRVADQRADLLAALKVIRDRTGMIQVIPGCAMHENALLNIYHYADEAIAKAEGQPCR